MTRAFKLAFWLVPLLLLAFILVYGVDVPFLDEWGLPNVFTAYHRGGTFQEVWWSQNNEHRQVVPRALWFFLAFATNWNVKAEMVVDWFVALCGLAALARLAVQTRSRPSSDALFWGGLLVSALAYCTIVQHQNWLWGFQFPFFFIQTMAIGGALALMQGRWPKPLRFALAALGCALATYSSAHGILTWAALVFCVWLLGGNWRKSCAWSAAWLALAASAFAVYRIGFVNKAAAISDPHYAFHHPFEVLLAFFVLLGSQFGPSVWVAIPLTSIVAGVLLAAAFGAVMLAAFWRRIPYPLLAPWLACAAFGAMFALVVAYGRSEWGYQHLSVVSRYVTGPPLLAVAFIQMSRLLLEGARPLPRPFRTAVPASWGVVGLLVVLSTAATLPEVARIRDERLLGKSMLRHHGEFDLASRLNPLYPLAPYASMCEGIPSALEKLDALGFRSSESVPFKHEQESAKLSGKVDPWMKNGKAIQGGPYKRLTVMGTVRVEAGARPPLILFKARNDGKLAGQLVPSGPSRREGGQDVYDWEMEFRAYVLGVENAELSFYALDREKETLVPLGGAVNRFSMRTLERSPVPIIRNDGSVAPGHKNLQ